MHGIAAITGNMHRLLCYFVLLEHITSYDMMIGVLATKASSYRKLKVSDVSKISPKYKSSTMKGLKSSF